MLGGYDTFGALPFGMDVDAGRGSLSSYELADIDPAQVAQYRVEMFPYDPVTDAVVPLRYSQVQDRLKLDDPFDPLVIQAIHYSTLIVQGEITARGGSVPNYGNIDVLIKPNEGATGDPALYRWGARDVHVYRGFRGIPQGEWKRVQSVKARRASLRSGRFTVQLRDPSIELQKPLSSTTYDGTEGNEELKDRHHPVCFGRPLNVTPVWRDRVRWIFQVHGNGHPIQGIAAGRDEGIEYINDGDIATGIPGFGVLASLEDWVTIEDTVGHYITDKATGSGRVGNAPNGAFTVDPEGHVRPDASFPVTQDEISRAMAQDFGGRIDDLLDLPSFARFALDNVVEAEFYDASGETNIIDAITVVMGGTMGGWTYNQLGQLEIGQLRQSPPSLTIDAEEIYPAGDGFGSDDTPAPIKARILKYDRNYTIQKEDTLAGALTDEESDDYDPAAVDLYGSEYRQARGESVAIPNDLDAEESTLETHLRNAPDGSLQAEADRQQALFARGAMRWRVPIKGRPGEARLWRTVRVKAPRPGFTGSGREVIVIGVEELSGDESTKLVVWG